MPSLRIVNYAVNGAGVGHLVRLVAMSRWLRRYASWLGMRVEIYFLTSSEADTLLFAERFASFKLPSKTVVADAGIDKPTWLALAKQWVWHSLGLLRPDILVVDTFPRGSFGELLNALDLARHRAFIYRPVKPEFGLAAEFQAMLPLYDTILVPEREADVVVPAEAQSRVVRLGPVMRRERGELLSREEARRLLGVPEDVPLVYVSAGGGGDAGAERHLHSVCDALEGMHLLVAAGPLYRGRPRYGPRITWVSHGEVVEVLPACDVAVSAAGYNSFYELMAAGVPTVFLPQEKVADDQAARAARAVACGAGHVLSDLGELRGVVEGWLHDTARRDAARALVGRNAARQMAAEVLKLAVPARHVEAAEEAMTDAVLTASRTLGLEPETLGQMMRIVDPAQDKPEAVSQRVIRMMQRLHEAAIPSEAVLRLGGMLAQRLERVPPLERAAAMERILLALAPFERWGQAATLLKVLAVERDASAQVFADTVTGFLARLRDEGQDLMAGVARLSELR
ncbi:MAG: glycosyltransferase [Candidatus Xenobia bacterium]